jgi:putative FmdB family regulatory protein
LPCALPVSGTISSHPLRASAVFSDARRVLPSGRKLGHNGEAEAFKDRLPEGVSMPTYDYLCKKCRKKFSLFLSIRTHEEKKVRCPKCKSTQVEQQLNSFFAVTSKKS